MRDWASLTERGRMRRLRTIVPAALDHYPIDATRVRFVGGFTNVVFRVDSDSGTFALRVDLHQDHTDEDVEIETAWLAALHRDTDLDVARVVETHGGAPFTHVGAEGIPEPRRCVLFGWIPGRPLGDVPTEAGYAKLGEMSARLHEHGATFAPPHRPMVWDRVFYWPEEVDPVVMFENPTAELIGRKRLAVAERVLELTSAAFDALEPGRAIVTHGDLHPDNVHVYRSRLIAFDFEDVVIAHRVQDVAVTLFYLRNHQGYPSFVDAFRDGYTRIAPWPEAYEGQMRHFFAARTLMFVNYVANLHDDPTDYFDTAFGRLEAYVAEMT